MRKIIILLSLLLVIVSCFDEHTVCVGVIKNIISVSAGGFTSTPMAAVELENGNQIILKGWSAVHAYSGVKVYSHTNLDRYFLEGDE